MRLLRQVDFLCKPKVSNFSIGVGIKQNGWWLDISVDDAALTVMVEVSAVGRKEKKAARKEFTERSRGHMAERGLT